MAETVSKKISQVFAGALPNEELVSKTAAALQKSGFSNESTLVATSLCCDELCRPLEKDLGEVFGQNFFMGGLAGFPFGGVTSFGAMAHHIPDGGNCLVVYGPHVGVDSTGAVGTVERRGRASGGACCGSAVAATGAVLKVHSGEQKDVGSFPTKIDEISDVQQFFVTNLMLPHAERLAAAKELYGEVPRAMFETQKGMMGEIISKAASAVAGEGKIAVLGGVQINTPEGTPDHFLPLQFELYDNSGKLLHTLSLDA